MGSWSSATESSPAISDAKDSSPSNEAVDEDGVMTFCDEGPCEAEVLLVVSAEEGNLRGDAWGETALAALLGVPDELPRDGRFEG